MLARCGRAAHICEANRNCTINENKNLRENRKESQLPSKSEGCNERYGFRGNCDSQGKLGMCPSLAESLAVGFSRNHVSRETMLLGKPIFHVRQKGVPPLLLPASVLQLPRCLVRIYNLDSHSSILFEFDSFKKCNCSRKNLLQIQFASQMWAARPHLGSIFEKLLHRKTFSFACGSYFIMHYKNLAALLPSGHTVHSPDAQHAP